MHTLLHSVPPALQRATANPHLRRRLLDTHGQVWISLLWGHCTFLLGPGAHKVSFVPPRVFPQSCANSDSSMVGLMLTSFKRVYAIPRSAAPRALPCSSPPLTCTSSGDAQTQSCLSLCGVSGSWCAQGLFEPFEHLA